ncbi:MAG: hypothetical protein ACI9Y1_003125 [Lentisphaeria bacterium]|jgi:hypothetical protein
MCLGVMGEYLARIFIEVKNRPLYIIMEKIGFEKTIFNKQTFKYGLSDVKK